MSPAVALVAYLCVVFGLLIVDGQRKSNLSKGLWIPCIWLGILASRPVSIWLSLQHGLHPSATVEAGSALDRNIDLVLMVVGAIALLSRQVNWSDWLRQNKWVVAYFIYCGVSILWSDFPEVALKRWIRAIGALIMILLVLSEPDPITAVRTVVRRCIYVLIPMSILFIKYFPDLGRDYDYWNGEEFLVGVGVNKNGLGRLCLVAGVFGLWDVLATWRERKTPGKKLNLLVSIAVLLLTLWLLDQSKSATSLLTFAIASCLILAFGLPAIRSSARYLGTITILVGVSVAAVLLMSNLLETIVLGLGRNMTFTTRTFLWDELLNMDTNPLFGVGYDSFWLGERLDTFIDKYKVNTAHNGYLEVYLELGIVGMVLLGGLVLSVFRRAKSSLLDPVSFDYGRVQFAILVLFLLYNITEVACKPRTLIFFLLLLVGIGFPRSLRSQATRSMARGRTGDASAEREVTALPRQARRSP